MEGKAEVRRRLVNISSEGAPAPEDTPGTRRQAPRTASVIFIKLFSCRTIEGDDLDSLCVPLCPLWLSFSASQQKSSASAEPSLKFTASYPRCGERPHDRSIPVTLSNLVVLSVQCPASPQFLRF